LTLTLSKIPVMKSMASESQNQWEAPKTIVTRPNRLPTEQGTPSLPHGREVSDQDRMDGKPRWRAPLAASRGRSVRNARSDRRKWGGVRLRASRHREKIERDRGQDYFLARDEANILRQAAPGPARNAPGFADFLDRQDEEEKGKGGYGIKRVDVGKA
jgi:hypothetical protein